MPIYDLIIFVIPGLPTRKKTENSWTWFLSTLEVYGAEGYRGKIIKIVKSRRISLRWEKKLPTDKNKTYLSIQSWKPQEKNIM